MKMITKILSGLAAGAVNSALGAGGGMIAVPMLKKSGMEQNRAQATRLLLFEVEAVSQNSGSDRDAASLRTMFRKVCAVLNADSGTRFPQGLCFGKRIPF